MPTATALYFLRNQLLGRAEFPTTFRPHSLAYFCSECGEVWGRVVCTMPGATPYWSVEHVPCQGHAPGGVAGWGAIPGAFCDGSPTKDMLSVMWWGRALEHLPPAVLQREFEITASYFERLHHGNQEAPR